MQHRIQLSSTVVQADNFMRWQPSNGAVPVLKKTRLTAMSLRAPDYMIPSRAEQVSWTAYACCLPSVSILHMVDGPNRLCIDNVY
jgi:hypothetical protein